MYLRWYILKNFLKFDNLFFTALEIIFDSLHFYFSDTSLANSSEMKDFENNQGLVS